jgi:hypothetical protein
MYIWPTILSRSYPLWEDGPGDKTAKIGIKEEPDEDKGKRISHDAAGDLDQQDDGR